LKLKSNSKNSPEAATQEVKKTLCTVITARTTASSHNKKQSQTINMFGNTIDKCV